VLLGFLGVVACTKADPGVVEVPSASEDDDDDAADDAAADDDDEGEAECEPGTERCDCADGDECDRGLECRSGLCVEAAGSSDDDDAPADDDSLAEPASDDAEPSPAGDDDVPVSPTEPEPAPAGGGSGSGEPEPSAPVAAGGAGAEPEPTPAGGAGGVAGAGGAGSEPVGSGGQSPGSSPDFVNPADNLLTNPDFALGDADWSVEAGTYGYTTDTGAMCLLLSGYDYNRNVGWPLSLSMAASLDPSLTYELSYDATATSVANLTFVAKVGEADTPYTPQFEADVNVQPEWVRFTHGFTPITTLPSGVVFIVSLSSGETEVCIDNVVLRVQ
jgi:hypothetical protein